MARSGKSGLGRGLNSLLGGSTYESSYYSEDKSKKNSTESNTTQMKKETETQAKVKSQPQPQSQSQSQPQAVAAELEYSKEYDENYSANYVVTENLEDEIQSFPEDLEEAALENVLSRQTDEVPIDSVIPNPEQPRTNFKKESLEELAASIQKDGLLQPILVRPLENNTYQIIAGERRWQAAKMAGMTTIPVRIKEADDDEALEMALIENVQRTDLNPIEEAYGYKRLMERKNLTQSELAQEVSKGRSTVANALRLLELPEEAQELLFEEKITAGHARAILSIPSKEGRLKLTEKLASEKLSVREAEAYARLLANQEKGRETPRQTTPKSYKMVAKTLQDVLKTNVRVRSSNGKNKIEIEFKDEEDLERLFGELTSNITQESEAQQSETENPTEQQSS